MFKRISVIALFLFLSCAVAFGAVGVKQDTSYKGEAMQINVLDGLQSFDGSTLTLGRKVEAATTNDSLTAAESGLTLVCTSVGGSGVSTITLPAATTEGLIYTIIDAKSSGTSSISVDPASTADSILFSESGTSEVIDGGDKLTSSGSTGDTVTLWSDGSNTWYVLDIVGTWSDGG